MPVIIRKQLTTVTKFRVFHCSLPVLADNKRRSFFLNCHSSCLQMRPSALLTFSSCLMRLTAFHVCHWAYRIFSSQLLTAVETTMLLLRVATPCRLEGGCQTSESTYHESARSYNLDDSHLRTHLRENSKSYIHVMNVFEISQSLFQRTFYSGV